MMYHQYITLDKIYHPKCHSLLGYNPKLLTILILLVIDVAVAASRFLSLAIIIPAVSSIVIKLLTFCAEQSFSGRCNMIHVLEVRIRD